MPQRESVATTAGSRSVKLLAAELTHTNVELLAAELTRALAEVELEIPQSVIQEIVKKEVSRPGFSVAQRAAETGEPLEQVVARMARPLFPLALASHLWDLQNNPDHETTERSNEKDSVTQTENPAPTMNNQLAAIQQRGDELSYVTQAVAGLGLEDAATEIQIAGLHEIATRCDGLARNIGLTALSEGKMSQRQLARLLGVAEMTVHRWRKDREEQEDQ